MSLSPTELGTPDHPARSLVPTLNKVLRYNSGVTFSEKTHICGRRERTAKLWTVHVTDAIVVVKSKGQLHYIMV